MLILRLRSALTYLVIGCYVALVGPPGMLLAVAFKWKGLLYELGHLGVKIGFLLSGIRYTVQGTDRVPPGRAVVFCSNHQSNIDPPVLFEALHRRVHVLYKQELDALPILARAFRIGGFIPIDRKNKESALRSIDAGAASIRAGNSFLIFPEGTRSRTGALLPFKKGGFIMAIKAQAPIVPVAIQGGRAAWQRGSWLIHPVHVRVKIGDPVETAGYVVDQRDAVIARVRAAIEALMGGDQPFVAATEARPA